MRLFMRSQYTQYRCIEYQTNFKFYAFFFFFLVSLMHKHTLPGSPINLPALAVAIYSIYSEKIKAH